jgi:hypothetical protein
MQRWSPRKPHVLRGQDLPLQQVRKARLGGWACAWSHRRQGGCRRRQARTMASIVQSAKLPSQGQIIIRNGDIFTKTWNVRRKRANFETETRKEGGARNCQAWGAKPRNAIGVWLVPSTSALSFCETRMQGTLADRSVLEAHAASSRGSVRLTKAVALLVPAAVSQGLTSPAESSGRH